MSTNEQAPTHQSLRVVGHLQTGCRQRGTHILDGEEAHLMMFDAMLCPRWCANEIMQVEPGQVSRDDNWY